MATTLSGPTLRAEADQWCLNKLPDLQKYSLVIHARELCKCLKSLWLQTRNLPTFMDTSSCSRVISRPVSRWPWTGLVYLFVFVFEGSNMLKLGMTIDLERVACTLVGRPDVDAAQGAAHLHECWRCLLVGQEEILEVLADGCAQACPAESLMCADFRDNKEEAIYCNNVTDEAKCNKSYDVHELNESTASNFSAAPCSWNAEVGLCRMDDAYTLTNCDPLKLRLRTRRENQKVHMAAQSNSWTRTLRLEPAPALVHSTSTASWRLVEFWQGPFQSGHSQQLRRVVRESEAHFKIEVLNSVHFASLVEPPATQELSRPFAFALRQKPWSVERNWAYPRSFRQVAAVLMQNQASLGLVPLELWVEHILPWFDVPGKRRSRSGTLAMLAAASRSVSKAFFSSSTCSTRSGSSIGEAEGSFSGDEVNIVTNDEVPLMPREMQPSRRRRSLCRAAQRAMRRCLRCLSRLGDPASNPSELATPLSHAQPVLPWPGPFLSTGCKAGTSNVALPCPITSRAWLFLTAASSIGLSSPLS
eukprot:s4490_g2.t1